MSENILVDQKENQKKLIYDEIDKIIHDQADLISSLEEIKSFVNIDTDAPNIGITLNNKLNELSQKFDDAGISIFSESVSEKIEGNPVGDAIFDDITLKIYTAREYFNEYAFKIYELVKKEYEKVKSYGNFRKFLYAFENVTIYKNNEDALRIPIHILNKLHVNLEKYKQLDEELWNYNLEDNLEDSLVSLINNDEYGYDKQDLKATIYTLKKLGLERLIPKIEEVEKDRESKSDNKSWNLTNSEKSEIQSKAKNWRIELKKEKQRIILRKKNKKIIITMRVDKILMGGKC